MSQLQVYGALLAVGGASSDGLGDGDTLFTVLTPSIDPSAFCVISNNMLCVKRNVNGIIRVRADATGTGTVSTAEAAGAIMLAADRSLTAMAERSTGPSALPKNEPFDLLDNRGQDMSRRLIDSHPFYDEPSYVEPYYGVASTPFSLSNTLGRGAGSLPNGGIFVVSSGNIRRLDRGLNPVGVTATDGAYNTLAADGVGNQVLAAKPGGFGIGSTVDVWTADLTSKTATYGPFANSAGDQLTIEFMSADPGSSQVAAIGRFSNALNTPAVVVFSTLTGAVISTRTNVGGHTPLAGTHGLAVDWLNDGRVVFLSSAETSNELVICKFTP